MGQKSLEVTAMGMEKPADKNANAQIKAYFCLKALFAICSWLEVKKEIVLKFVTELTTDDVRKNTVDHQR